MNKEIGMCTVVAIRDGDLIETVGELADALGIDAKTFSVDPRENCLCNADFAAAAKASGKLVRRADSDEGFPWPEYIFE